MRKMKVFNKSVVYNQTGNAEVLVLLAFGSMAALTGCDDRGQILLNPLQLQGRVSFADDWSCAAPVSGSQEVSWEECHQFKRSFDGASGEYLVNPVGSDSPRVRDEARRFVPGVLRPISATLRAKTWAVAQDGTQRLCGQKTFQTDADGVYSVLVPNCGEGVRTVVTGELFLQHSFYSKDYSRSAAVRAVWPTATSDAVFTFASNGEVRGEAAFSTMREEGRRNYALPKLVFESAPQVPSPVTTGFVTFPTLNLGNRVFLRSTADDQYNYMRQVLSTFQSIVELNRRLKREFTAENSSAANSETRYFDRMFERVNRESGWGNNYMIWLDNSWGYGFFGGIGLFGPNQLVFNMDADANGAPDGSLPVARLLSNTDLLGHEFSHSIHAAFAPESQVFDYSFASPMRRPSRFRPRNPGDPHPDYDWGHGFGQYQEMGASAAEGLANSMGQFLINRCQNWVNTARPQGGASRFAANMWNADFSCDATLDSNGNYIGDGCNAHHVRWYLARRRGITNEAGAAWQTAVTGLQGLTNFGVMLNQGSILSNSEGRYQDFGCDLLDGGTPAEQDVSYARGLAGRRYIKDFTYYVGEILAGNSVTLDSTITQTYDTDPVPEQVRLSFVGLLIGLGGTCRDGACVDDGATGHLARGNTWGTNYNRTRLSVSGSPLSPQNLGKFLIRNGQIRDRADGSMTALQELNNLLKANQMEEITTL
jgi:hypothetical protein